MVNLSVPEGPTSLVSSLPLAPAPLRGRGVDIEISMSVTVIVPFIVGVIVVVGRPWVVGKRYLAAPKSDSRTGHATHHDRLQIKSKADMFGAFRPTVAVNVGLLWCVCVCNLRFSTSSEIRNYRKVPWRLSVTRKANVRDRLKKVDAVIEAVRASGVQCTALVCSLTTITSKI